MRIPGSLDVESILEKCSEHDLVVTPYPSLADTLNSRLDGTRVSTPRSYASGNQNFREEVFLELVDKEEVNWKKANYLIDAAISCWRHTGKPQLENFDFSDEDARKTQEVLRNQDTYLKNLSDVEWPENTAVLFYEHMDELEKNSMPENVDKIEVMTGGDEELPRFYSYSSAGTLVQSLMENLESFNAEDVGIVVSSDSRYHYLIESRLEAENISYRRRESLARSEKIRTFISLLRISFTGKRARVSDLKPILDHLNIENSGGNGRKLLQSLEGNLDEFKEFFNTIQYLEFGEVIEGLEDFGYKDEDMEKVLKDSGLWGSKVSRENINLLEHYLQRFTEQERSDKGILLADPAESVKIDRETVFFIGLEDDWETDIQQYPWIPEEELRENHRERLASLLESGRRRVFMVQEKEMERPVRPCNDFVEILDDKITNFSDLDPVRVKPEKFEKGEGFEKEDIQAEIRKVETISQSKLNSLVLSPRLFYFYELLEEEDELSKEKGNIFHDFAEFYVNYPSYVKEEGLSRFEKLSMDKLDPFLDDVEKQEIEKELSLGLRSLIRFIDSVEIQGESLKECDNYSTNFFAKELGKGLRMKTTELFFDQEELGARGKVDLACSDRHIVDFKSGRKYSKRKIAKKSKVQTYEDQNWPDFQAPMYLSYLRYRDPGEELKFSYFYFLHNISEQVKGDFDSEEMEEVMNYYPVTFDRFKSRKELFEELTSGVSESNSRRKTLEKMGYSRYREFMENTAFPGIWDKKEIEHSEFVEKFEKFAKKEVGDHKYVEEGVRTASKIILEKKIVNYFKDDLNLFEEFLQQKIEELNRYKEEGFPLNEDTENLPEKDLLVK